VSVEVQAHRANDRETLRRHLAAAPDSVELDVGLRDGALVVAHDYDLGDASALTLDEALDLAGGTPLVVEAKCSPPETATAEEFARALGPYLDRVRVISFEPWVLREVRRLDPDAEIGFLFEEAAEVTAFAPTVGPRYGLVTAELVEQAHALGVRVVPWTVNDAEEMERLLDLGVDGLVTDEPALARRVVASRG
jgi:glycerophosphoryl diester phosphodiesterase